MFDNPLSRLLFVFSFLVQAACSDGGGGDKKTVVLSGGCFQNQILTRGLTRQLEAHGLKVYTQDLVPVNDGGISLGQAVCAGERVRV